MDGMDQAQESNPPPSSWLGTGTTWAVLVGIDEYEDTQSFGNLQNCQRDATRLRQQLIKGGIPEKHITLLADQADRPDRLPLREHILAALQALVETIGPDDLLLFYFSGHCETEKNESYLLSRNSKGANLRDTAISIKRVKEIIADAQTRAKVLILDTCHSGADTGTKGRRKMTDDFLQQTFRDAEGIAILSSCKAGQLSYDWPAKEHSVFTYYLLEALQGLADNDDKGFVSVMDVNRYVTYHVKTWAFQEQLAQSPTLQYQVIGDIILLSYQPQDRPVSRKEEPGPDDEEELDPADEEHLKRYFGDLKAFREGNLHQHLTEQLAREQQIVPRQIPQQAPEDVFKRYNRIPLHAMMLYTEADPEIIQYLKNHFAELQALFADACDLYLIMDQFRAPQDSNAYTMMQNLPMVRPADYPSYTALPALLFWDHQGASTYLSFASSTDAAAITMLFRQIGDALRRAPTIEALRNISERQSNQAHIQHKGTLQMAISPLDQEPAARNQMDVGILITMDEELDVFFSLFPASIAPVPAFSSNETLFRFEGPSSPDQRPYQCVLSYIGEKGPIEAALATAAMIKGWHPKTLVMLGMAAGIHPNIRLGDVIAARSIDSYTDQGKIHAGKQQAGMDLLFSGQVYQCSSSLLATLRTFKYAPPEAYKNWQQDCRQTGEQLLGRETMLRLEREGQMHALPTYSIGPLASGPFVVASTVFKQGLQLRNRDLLGLEMETGGMMTALHSTTDPHHSLVLQGVVDFGDEQKKILEESTENAVRQYGMYNAVRLFWELLKTGAFPYADANDPSHAQAQKSGPQISPYTSPAADRPAQPSATATPPPTPRAQPGQATTSPSDTYQRPALFNLLSDILTDTFEKWELEGLCHDLGISFANLEDQSQRTRGQALVRRMKQLGRLDELEYKLRESRPNSFKNHPTA